MTPLDKLAARNRHVGTVWLSEKDIAIDEALIAVARAAQAMEEHSPTPTGYTGGQSSRAMTAHQNRVNVKQALTALDSAITEAMEET